MLVSFTLPCHRREDDLAVTLPVLMDSAAASPPCEVLIVDYGNTGHPVLEVVAELRPVKPWWGVDLRVVEYRGRDHFHMAHARNVGIRAAAGEVVVITSCDIRPLAGFVPTLRKRFKETGATWLRPDTFEYVGVVAVRRDELVAAGGYDERFEFYGGEDRELHERLERRGARWATYPAAGLVEMTRTPNARKVEGYRLPLTKTEMLERGSAIRLENQRRGVLVANEGREWGLLTGI